jgi:curved DNA-binding protein CbpA
MQATADSRQPEEGVPQLVDGWESQGLRLTPSEGFLLSRIDGATSWASLRQIAGMPPDEVDACLARWIAQGIVALGDAPPADDAAGAPPADGALDPGLDLSLELQRRILDFEARLDRAYHELLGVATDADARTIKRAFFALSKEFHPDRYFRRNVGSHGPRLARIFKRVALAYEMLSDPATRAEIQRVPQAEAPAPAADPGAPVAEAATRGAGAKAGVEAAARAPRRAPAGAPARARTRKREALDRLRRHFRIPEEVLRERRFRASRLHDAARQELARRHFADAASAMRLAIAFDPWNDAYKEEFAVIQAELHHQRATELLAGAEATGATAADTLRQLEEALHFRPSDARLYHRAAELALQQGEVERAHEYAERACELAEDVAAHFSTLGRVLRRMGEAARARQAFERAQGLDPGDVDAARELDRLRRQRPARSRSGGTR